MRLRRKGTGAFSFPRLLGFLSFLLSYFEKIAHMSVVQAYVSLWLCGFEALYVGMFVARANKVEGTMS